LKTAAPELGEAPDFALPDFEQPEFDQSRVDFHTDRLAAYPRAQLRDALRRALVEARAYDNPNVAKMFTREALGGYGQGLGGVMGQARQAGLQNYLAGEYNPALQGARTNYAADVEEARTAYEQQMEDRRQQYMRDLAIYNQNRTLYHQYLPELFGSGRVKSLGGWSTASNNPYIR
jgi:hypothetical protein